MGFRGSRVQIPASRPIFLLKSSTYLSPGATGTTFRGDRYKTGTSLSCSEDCVCDPVDLHDGPHKDPRGKAERQGRAPARPKGPALRSADLGYAARRREGRQGRKDSSMLCSASRSLAWRNRSPASKLRAAGTTRTAFARQKGTRPSDLTRSQALRVGIATQGYNSTSAALRAAFAGLGRLPSF